MKARHIILSPQYAIIKPQRTCIIIKTRDFHKHRCTVNIAIGISQNELFDRRWVPSDHFIIMKYQQHNMKKICLRYETIIVSRKDEDNEQ